MMPLRKFFDVIIKLKTPCLALGNTFHIIIVIIPAVAAMTVAIWLERVIFLKWYCVKLQKSGTDPCVGKAE